MRRLYCIPAVALLLFAVMTATTIVACGGENNPGEGRDTTAAAADSAAAAPDAATIAEIDRVIGQYVVAADSLATLFDQLKTVEDVEKANSKITTFSGTIRNFHAQSARYGQPLVERMTTPRVDSAWEHLVRSREQLQKNAAVYARVSQIEDEAGKAGTVNNR